MSFNVEQSMLATFILPIAQALRSQGLDAMALVEEVGIGPSAVINADRRVYCRMGQAPTELRETAVVH